MDTLIPTSPDDTQRSGQKVGIISQVLAGAGLLLGFLVFLFMVLFGVAVGVAVLVVLFGLALGMAVGLAYHLNRKRLWVRQADRVEAFVRDDPVLSGVNPDRLPLAGLMIFPLILALRWTRRFRRGDTPPDG